MERSEIHQLITSYVEQSLAGLETEHPKFDFKSQWYDLKTKPGISEFVKDATAMANTVGLDGFIVLGFNEKTKEFKSTTFKDSGLRDSSEIVGLINKCVQILFDIETLDVVIHGHSLSVIHIPPSLNKPHVIKSHLLFDKKGNVREEENKIFVRKNTKTASASKYDLDLMYYDRKNIIPDYEVFSHYNISSLQFHLRTDHTLAMTAHLTIENTGRRPVAISKTSVGVQFGEGDDTEAFTMISDVKSSALVIKSGEIWNDRVDYTSKETFSFSGDSKTRNMKAQYYRQERNNIKTSHLKLDLANGHTLYSELNKIMLF